ncbi:hemolymph lipopolysaccharide-binding protein-like [Diprion similis]|uniref:hemolymph lipopolysaccharide-binding protein-like n=1 Tax=Diprion similis TaxID=362088 RepID=UPI001EF9155E|nr:hemolymph lipopolysaccharide-binding protein-like [Diprion similis]
MNQSKKNNGKPLLPREADTHEITPEKHTRRDGGTEKQTTTTTTTTSAAQQPSSRTPVGGGSGGGGGGVAALFESLRPLMQESIVYRLSFTHHLSSSPMLFIHFYQFRHSFRYVASRRLRGPTTPPCLLRGKTVPRRDDYTYFADLGAGYKFHIEKKSWFDARIACEKEGGHLAVINSFSEAEAVTLVFWELDKTRGFPHVAFIGFHDLFREGEYLTIHGQSLEQAGYQLWQESQPNDFDNTQNCGGIHNSGLINDINCEAEYEFICEIKDPEHNIS